MSVLARVALPVLLAVARCSQFPLHPQVLLRHWFLVVGKGEDCNPVGAGVSQPRTWKRVERGPLLQTAFCVAACLFPSSGKALIHFPRVFIRCRRSRGRLQLLDSLFPGSAWAGIFCHPTLFWTDVFLGGVMTRSDLSHFAASGPCAEILGQLQE